MSNFSNEALISEGVKYVTEEGVTYFNLSDLKKKIKGVKVNSGDIKKKEIDGKFVQVVSAVDIRQKPNVKEIVVVEAEFVPCGEGCGCLMSQEDAEKALCKAEKEEKVVEVKEKATTKKGK